MAKTRLSLPVLAPLVGLTVYLIAFFGVRLPSLEQASGRPWRRYDFFQFLLVPENLAEMWFGSPPELAIWDRLPVLAIAAGILAGAAAIGWMLLALVRVEHRLDKLETLVFSTAVGLNVLSTYTLAVGLGGWLPTRAVLILPALAAIGGAAWWRRRRSKACARRGSAHPAADEITPQLSPRWLWVAVPLVLVIVLGGMLPPIEFDVREYHLQAPKEFFQQGSIGFVPHNIYANMPLGTEMLSLLAMVIAGQWWLGALAGKTVIAAFTLLTALGLVAAGRRFFSSTVGIVAALVYLSVPWIVQVSTSGLVEGASACYWLLAVYAMFLWREVPRPLAGFAATPSSLGRHYLALAGYLAGGAVACKYPAALFVVMPLIVWTVAAHLPGHWRACWKPLGVLLLSVGAGCGLWFAKNVVLTGNPTYPLLAEVFPSKTRTPEKIEQWNRNHRPHGFSLARLGADLATVGLRSEWLGALIMPLGALGLLNRRYRRHALLLFAWFVYAVAVWWLCTHRIDRFWVPVLPLVALLAGLGACWALTQVGHSSAGPWVVGLLLSVCALWGLLAVTSVAGGYNRYFVSLERIRSDPEWIHDPWHRYFNAHVGDGRVLLVGDAQPFDFEVPVLYSTCFDDSLFEQLVKGHTADHVRRALADQKITHVYVHWGEIARYRDSGYGFTDFVQPAVFENLVTQGVLDPLPVLTLPSGAPHPGRGYRVLLRAGATHGNPQRERGS